MVPSEVIYKVKLKGIAQSCDASIFPVFLFNTIRAFFLLVRGSCPERRPGKTNEWNGVQLVCHSQHQVTGSWAGDRKLW